MLLFVCVTNSTALPIKNAISWQILLPVFFFSVYYLQPNYIPTLEDKIEAERQKKIAELKENGKGTKVTQESFAIWQEKKRKRKTMMAKKMVEQELKKKKGGKGLAVLSGRALYEYKKDLFDDPTSDEVGDDGNGSEKAFTNDSRVEEVVTKVQTDLFLEGDDDDSLDDMDDD